MNYSSSKFDHWGHEAKDHFLWCCCWGPRCFYGIKRTVAGGERVGASKAVQCCCRCPIFRDLLRSSRHFCSFPRKARHDGVTWQRLLSSSQQGAGPQQHNKAPGHFLLLGLVPQCLARGGRVAQTTEFPMQSTEVGGLSNPEGTHLHLLAVWEGWGSICSAGA